MPLQYVVFMFQKKKKKKHLTMKAMLHINTGDEG